MTLLQRHKITIAITTVYWLALAVVTHIPIPNWVRKTGFSDKTMHCLAYFILACLLWFVISPDKKANWRRLRVWLVLLIIVVYGIVDEVLQGYIGRSASVNDFIADILGALTGFAVVSFLSYPHAMLLLVVISMFTLPGITKSGLVVSAGLCDKGMSFIAFAFLTVVWIQYKQTILNLNRGRVSFIITSLVLPLTVLICVKLFCVFRDTSFDLSSVIAAALGILTTVLIWHIRRSVLL
jgi:VanZ family protein